ncbi:unnamed protein product [Miscanthus lutarioriparius]|uniref:Uncharacterized protein n=1 Tax=Miscanthus lutarioriparius TaxID=422564 RepID=A0A811P3L5_9POAL|nr:unnamed protein product [Miscanthus lutarioriparius]
MTGTGGGGEHYSRQVRELCALLLTIVSPAPGPGQPVSMSPAAAASMLLGASVALMLCGSVTFALGLLLMPWVAGLALLFGFAGAVNTLSSGLFLSATTASSPPPPRRSPASTCGDGSSGPRPQPQ